MTSLSFFSEKDDEPIITRVYTEHFGYIRWTVQHCLKIIAKTL